MREEHRRPVSLKCGQTHYAHCVCSFLWLFCDWQGQACESKRSQSRRNGCAVKAFFQHQRARWRRSSNVKTLSVLGIVAAVVLFCAAPLSLHWSPTKTFSLSVDTADARIGRPLTPMSVAGVNRRVHRRAYYGAAAAGAAGYGYYNYARRCAYWHAGVCRRWY